MGGRRILSDQQLDEMVELRERGLTCRQIAKHFTIRGTPISVGAISWQCLRLGADLPVERRRSCPAVEAREFSADRCERSGFVVRRYSAEDDRLLIALEAEGLTYRQIGDRFDPPRKHNSVKGRLLTLARRQARAEEGLEA